MIKEAQVAGQLPAASPRSLCPGMFRAGRDLAADDG